MQAMPASLRRTLATLSFTAVLGLSGCQEMTTFVTGEHFPKPPENSPRIEVELAVEIEPAVWGDVIEHGDLEAKIADQVHAVADLGMRFYPVLSSEYAEGDPRPELLLTVRVTGLEIESDHDRVEKKNEPPRIESKVKGLDSSATAVVQRRRDAGPALVVASAEADGYVHAVSQEKVEERALAGEAVFGVVKQDASHQDLRVCESDVLQAVDEAVVGALRGVIKGVDRELELEAPAAEKP